LVRAALPALLAASCGGAPPPPPLADPAPGPVEDDDAAEAAEPAAPVKEPVSAGKDCVKAEAECGGGVCLVTLKNGCEQPVTCDLFVTAICQAKTDRVEARARKRDTFAAKTDGPMSAEAKCSDGNVIHTEVQELRCE
jgi:hypothetical protein